MLPLLTAEQMRTADRESVESFELPELLLMEHAAMALLGGLQNRFGELLPKTRGVVLAGIGNNGGDVLAVARLLMEKRCHNLFVVLVGAGKPLSASAQKQLALLAHLGVAWGKALSPELLGACDWILDGMLGTGLSRPLEPAFQDAIELVNQFAGKKWILSADIPSGLSADTGHPMPVAVKASATVTFGFYKRGLVTGEAVNYVGELALAPIQIPATVSSQSWNSFLYDEEDAVRLPERRKDSHKGNFGRVAIVAGPANREGAAALSALGALKTGAGLVTVHAPADTIQTLRPRLAPEVMTEVLGPALFKNAQRTSIVVGPGLGTQTEGWNTLKLCLEAKDALVIDADGLTLLAQHASLSTKLLAAREHLPTILTPHPKEAAVLLDCSVADIEKDRYASVRALSDKWNCAVVLKGAGSLCTSPASPIVAVRAGDSGLSKGGSGDVLSGILASFLAQGLSVAQAAPLAVFVHGRASELLTARYGHSRSSLAGEVASAVADVLGSLEWKASR
jgi:ADP-dependent NAD(P)H-hydrate dehydratase / NAD(P)H-hydrate epimerase